MPNLFDVPSPKGPYGPPNMADTLYKMISGLPEDYYKGEQMARTRALQKPYTIPTDESGKVDYAKFLRDIGQFQGLEGAAKVVPDLIGMQSGADIQREIAGGGTPTSTTPHTTPSYQPDSVDPNQLRRSAGQQPRQAEQGAAAGYSIRDLVERSAFNFPDKNSVIGSIARNLRIGPTAPLDRDQLSQVSAEIENEYGGRSSERGGDNAAPVGGYGYRPDDAGSTSTTAGSASTPQQIPPNAAVGATPGDNIVPRRVQTVQAPPIQGLRPMQAPQAAPTGVPPYSQAEIDRLDNRATKLNAIAASPKAPAGAAASAKAAAEQAAAQAKQMREINAKYGEPTGEQKNAPPGMSVPQAAAYGAALKAQAEASMKNVGARIEGIRPAQDSIQTLDAMSDAFKVGGKNVSTGPGAQNWLKVKQAVNNWAGTDIFKGVPESEQIEKLNAQLSSAVVKAMTPRPTQFEFKAFQSQLPGLLTSRGGSANLIDILRQTKVQELELGRMADKFRPGEGKSWSEVEEKYFDDHPIISPLTHHAIDAKQAKDGKWYRENPEQPDPTRPYHWRLER